jgi:hypothetical protein
MSTKKKRNSKEKISRKTALKKIGLTAASVATMVILLNEPAKGQDNGDSPDQPPVWP